MATNTGSKDTWRNILAFLAPKDYYNLITTSKTLYLTLKPHEILIVKQFFERLVGDQDYFLSSIYQNTAYVNRLKTEIKNAYDDKTVDFLKKFNAAKSQLEKFLEFFSGSEKPKQLIKLTNNALLRPLLAPLPIRRDFQTCETFSLFQIHVNDANHGLEFEAQPYEMASEGEIYEFPEEMMKMDDRIKEIILRCRWYMDVKFKSDDGLSNFLHKARPVLHINNEKFSEEITEQDLHPFIRIYVHLQELFSSFCRLMANYLENIKDPFLFITEYGCKWKNYTMSMQTIGDYMRQFSGVMNEVYDLIYSKEYPGYPNFSIWRMMTRIWFKEVVQPLNTKMKSNFQTVLEAYLDGFNVDKKQLLTSEFSMDVEGIPDALSQSEEDVCGALRDYWYAMIDFAIHEKSVAFISSTDFSTMVPTSTFYTCAQEAIIQRCRNLLEQTRLKPGDKFVILQKEKLLLESIIPPVIFSKLYLILVEAQQKVLADCLSQVKEASYEEVVNYVNGINGPNSKYIVEWIFSDGVTLGYQALREHLKIYGSNIEEAKNIKEYLEKKKKDENGPHINELQKSLLAFHSVIDFPLLESCKEVKFINFSCETNAFITFSS